MKKYFFIMFVLFVSEGFSQETSEDQRSNIQEYTPSKLLKKGQWDIKFFYSLYTQTKKTDAGSSSFAIPRETFVINTTEIYAGISENSRVNIGFIFQIRSNTFGGTGVFDVFQIKDNDIDARSGLTTIAPSIRVQPFVSISNFSFTSSVYFPVFEDRANAPYLDKRSVFWETKFFFDKTFGGGN